MPGLINKLTVSSIKSPLGKRRMGDGAGLWLNNSANGGKSWVFRWSPKGGKPREMGLGPYPAVRLAKARELAAHCREQVAAGKDPKTERDRLTGNTFGQVADLFLETMGSRWTNEKPYGNGKPHLVTGANQFANDLLPRLIHPMF